MSSHWSDNNVGSISVLHVDDEADTLTLTKMYLEDVDPSLNIVSVDSPKEALKLLRNHFFECVLSDYLMPDIDGVQLCLKIRKLGEDIPFIIYTGHGSEEVAEKAFVAGINDYIRKDGSLGDYVLLAQRIRQAVEKHRVEDLYRTMVEGSRDAFGIIQGTAFKYVNQAMADLIGVRDPRELVDSDILRWVADEDRETIRSRTLSRQDGEPQPKLYEYTLKRTDGKLRNVEVSVSPIKYLGKPAVLVFNRDITESKKFEASLQKERDLLQAVMNGARNMHIVYLDRDFNFVRVNEAYAETCGYQPEEMIGINHFDLYPHEENEAIFARVRDTGIPVTYHDKPFVFPDQPERGVTYWDWTLEPIKDSSGSVEGVVFSLVETTDRKRLEDSLKKSEEQLSRANEELNDTNELLSINNDVLNKLNNDLFNMVESSNIPMIVVDNDLKIRRVTDAAERAISALQSDIGRPVKQLRLSEDLPDLEDLLLYTIKNLKQHMLEVRGSDGRWYSMSIRPYISRESRIEGAIIALADIEEIMRARIKLNDYALNLEKMVEDRSREISVVKDRLESFIESQSDPFVIWNEEFNLVHANNAMLKFFPPGTRIKDIIGKNIKEISPGVENSERYSKFLEVLKTGEPAYLQNIPSLTGYGNRLYDVKIFRLKEGIGVVNYDVTERLQMEEKLRESGERLQGFMNSATDGFALYDSELKLLDANSTVINRFPKGTKKDDLIGKKITELYPGMEKTVWYEAYLNVLKTGEPYFNEGLSGVSLLKNRIMQASAFKVGTGLGVISRDITEHKRLEIEAMEAKNRLDSFINAAEELFLMYDKDLNLIELNKAALRTFQGRKKEDIIGKNIIDLAPGIEKTDRYGQYLKVIETGVPQHVGSVAAMPGFEHRIYDLRLFKVGSGLGIMATDVTEHMEAVEKLRAASIYSRSLLEASLDPLVTISPDGKITDVNIATESATGISREQLIGSDFSDYFTEPEKAREGYQKVFSEGSVRDYPLALRNSSGMLTDVHYNATVYRNEKGEVEGVFAAARDITERKKAEEKLKAASLYARGLLEASLDPLVTISTDGKILDVNTATEVATGVPREKLIGSDFSNYFTEPEKAREGYRQVFEKGFVRDYPLAIRHITNKITDVLYNATVYKNDKGEVEGIFAAARDVTEKKQMEEKLRHAERMEAISRMSAMIAHDLRGPLSIVNQAADLIKKSPERSQKLLRMIKSNTTRALNMIEEIRIGTKEIRLQLEETDLASMIKTTLEETRIPDNVKVKLQVGRGLNAVRLDPGIIRRALDNLVSNAVEAMPDGGTLTLRARREGSQVRVDVCDTGSGIPDEIISHIFETFYSTKPKGLGLGLPYCRRAVEAHGGSISFTTKKGQGTILSMTIPYKGN